MYLADRWRDRSSTLPPSARWAGIGLRRDRRWGSIPLRSSKFRNSKPLPISLQVHNLACPVAAVLYRNRLNFCVKCIIVRKRIAKASAVSSGAAVEASKSAKPLVLAGLPPDESGGTRTMILQPLNLYEANFSRVFSKFAGAWRVAG